MRMLVVVLVMTAGLSACSVTGAVVSVASTAVGVAADVGTAAVKGTYRAGKAVASTLDSPPEREAQNVTVAPSTTTAPDPLAVGETDPVSVGKPEPEERAAEEKPRKSRVDRLAGY